MDFGFRNEDAAKSRELLKHFPTYKPSDRFFVNAQFSRAGELQLKLAEVEVN